MNNSAYTIDISTVDIRDFGALGIGPGLATETLE